MKGVAEKAFSCLKVPCLLSVELFIRCNMVKFSNNYLFITSLRYKSTFILKWRFW